MTMARVPRTGPEGPGRAGSGTPEDGIDRKAPVIVLTYANAGGPRLQSLLVSQPELTCTSGTGVLAACERAGVAWRQMEGRPANGLSALAVKSIRAMVTMMITSATVRSGRSRWCEMAAAEPSAAEAFLEVFPGTRFVCVQRSCPDLVSAMLLASPWGLSGAAFAPFVAAYPGSSVAALAAWWVAHAGPLLEFERTHPGACIRLSYEDIADSPDATLHHIRQFLGLGGPHDLPPEPVADADQAPADDADLDPSTDLPVDQIPPALLSQVNLLHAELGYPRVGTGDLNEA